MGKKKIIIATTAKRGPRKYNTFLNRFMRVLTALNRNGYIRTRPMAAELEVSERTLQRLLLAMRDDHFILPDEHEKGKWIFNSEAKSFEKLDINDQDAATMAFLCQLSRIFGGQINKSVLQSLEKAFTLEETDSPFFMITPRVKQPDTQLPFYQDLYNAIQFKYKINLTYLSGTAEKTVKVWPFSLIMCDGMWYLGYLLEPEAKRKQEIRTLRYTHILKVEPLVEENFEKPAWIKETLKDARNIWFNRDRCTRVVMEVSNRIKDYFELTEYFPAQKIIAQGPETFKVEAKICVHNEAVPNIMRFLPDIKVLEPKELKDEVNRRIADYLANKK
jgi:predicted DNA-binding transcriptional regulator YafY